MTIHIPNPETTSAKLSQLKKDGLSALHIIADFDRTLTKDQVNGQESSSSFAQIRNGGYLSEEYILEAKRLFSVYYPIEIDPTIPNKEKTKKMQEWWHLHMELMIKHGITQSIFEDIVTKQLIQGRPGLYNLLHFTAERDIPFLIFSAGLGDLIKAYLNHERMYFKNIHIISNLFQFNETGSAVGLQNKMITALNKSEVAIANTPFAKEIDQRPNVILLGDSLADAGMTADLTHQIVLKIGFLNKLTQLLPEFEKSFDVILFEDEEINYVTELIKSLA